jgi:hypothetical protein
MDASCVDARMVAMLPCVDIDRTAQFWVALGLTVTYRQQRPNPFVALERGGIALQYYGLDGLEPDANHSTCGIVVDDTEPLHRLFIEGLVHTYGRVPLRGLPRITRPRRRANNAGLSGFSVVDPDGNWIRVSRRPDRAEDVPKAIDDRTEWVSQGGGPLARAVENAVVMADSHGIDAQAHRLLAGALSRHPESPVAERAAAWAYLAELSSRLGDEDDAGRARSEVLALSRLDGLTAEDLDAVGAALRELEEIGL